MDDFYINCFDENILVDVDQLATYSISTHSGYLFNTCTCIVTNQGEGLNNLFKSLNERKEVH